MALTAGQLTQIQTYVAASQSQEAVEYLVGLRAYIHQKLGKAA